MRDSAGKEIPVWARYIEELAATTSNSGYQKNGKYVPFAIYCESETEVEFTPIENSSPVTMTLAKGYHPIAVTSVGAVHTVAIHLLFPYNPS